jgi:ATP-dependent protease ClpP protease subunit
MFSINKKTGEIYLYDAIGPSEFWGMETGMIDSQLFTDAMEELQPDQRILLRINSPGGYVDEAIAIYSLLERHPGGVDVAIDSLAASAASFIAMVGEKITISKAGAIMIHGPQGGVIGNEAEIRSYADMMGKYAERLTPIYADRSGKDADAIRALLTGENWYTAQEAVAEGFAHEVGNAVAVEAKIVPKTLYRNTPAAFMRPEGQRPSTVRRELAAVVNRRLAAG